jgi:hypothetical protein
MDPISHAGYGVPVIVIHDFLLLSAFHAGVYSAFDIPFLQPARVFHEQFHHVGHFVYGSQPGVGGSAHLDYWPACAIYDLEPCAIVAIAFHYSV